MARTELPSLRFGRLESKRLILAILISLLLHGGVWGTYHLAKKYHWLEQLRALLHIPRPVAAKTVVPPKPETEVQPTVYVDVDQADTEPPKNTINYSSKNSHAANPDADQQSDQPKINGHQTDILKTQDVPRQDRLKPQPPQPPSPQTKPQPEDQSSPLHLGDRELQKVETNQPAELNKPEKQRPRTLKEAREQQHLPAQMTKQNGGVKRVALVAAFDAKATSFGEYDSKLIAAITQYWYDEMDSHQYAADRTGKVRVSFNLHYDGSVDNVQIIYNDVGVLLGSWCQEAIQQTAPYEKWPSDMLHEIGNSQTQITFTFFYK